LETDHPNAPNHPAIIAAQAELKAVFDLIEVGRFYKFELAGRYMEKTWRSKVYRVLSKRKHHDWAYSVLCQGLDSKGNEAVIYHWIVPSSATMSEHIRAVTEVEGYHAD
jgi:hypothetical protein